MTDHAPNTLGPDPDPPDRGDRARQARAWSIALDPVYGLIGMGLLGYGIDALAGTGARWTTILAITGLIVGFYRFIREAKSLNAENASRWAGRPYRDVDPDADEPHDPD